MFFTEYIRNGIEIITLAVMFFYILRVLRGTRGLLMFTTVMVFLAALWLLSSYFALPVLKWLAERLWQILPIFLIVIFQQEIRRILTMLQVGSVRTRTRKNKSADHPQTALLLPVIEHLMVNKEGKHVGALIAIEQTVGLESWSVTGSIINAKLHRDDKLLETIFYEGSPLHDGGVIIRKKEILAAACTFPLSGERDDGDVVYGMRHKAALGLSEQSDAIVIVVSEETGAASLAYNGKIERMKDMDQLRNMLNSHLLPLELRDSNSLAGSLTRMADALMRGCRIAFLSIRRFGRHRTGGDK